MNCDDVFVILTRGPFPSGSQDDAEVERHLQVCMECHRLAEALRPNDAALRDATGEQEISALPGYWGDLVGVPTVSVADTADFSRPKRVPRLRSQRQLAKNLNVGQFAAAVALGIVLAAALRTLVTVSPPKQPALPPITPALLVDRHSYDADRLILNLLAELPRDCRAREKIDRLLDSTLATLTRHDSPGPEAPNPNGTKLLGVVSACASCHGLDELRDFAEHTSLSTRAN